MSAVLEEFLSIPTHSVFLFDQLINSSVNVYVFIVVIYFVKYLVEVLERRIRQS